MGYISSCFYVLSSVFFVLDLSFYYCKALETIRQVLSVVQSSYSLSKERGRSLNRAVIRMNRTGSTDLTIPGRYTIAFKIATTGVDSDKISVGNFLLCPTAKQYLAGNELCKVKTGWHLARRVANANVPGMCPSTRSYTEVTWWSLLACKSRELTLGTWRTMIWEISKLWLIGFLTAIVNWGFYACHLTRKGIPALRFRCGYIMESCSFLCSHTILRNGRSSFSPHCRVLWVLFRSLDVTLYPCSLFSRVYLLCLVSSGAWCCRNCQFLDTLGWGWVRDFTASTLDQN